MWLKYSERKNKFYKSRSLVCLGITPPEDTFGERMREEQAAFRTPIVFEPQNHLTLPKSEYSPWLSPKDPKTCQLPEQLPNTQSYCSPAPCHHSDSAVCTSTPTAWPSLTPVNPHSAAKEGGPHPPEEPYFAHHLPAVTLALHSPLGSTPAAPPALLHPSSTDSNTTVLCARHFSFKFSHMHLREMG